MIKLHNNTILYKYFVGDILKQRYFKLGYSRNAGFGNVVMVEIWIKTKGLEIAISKCVC